MANNQMTEATKTASWGCLIVGAGPAALSAAVYTARENIPTLIIERAVIGGLSAITDKVDNYPGFVQGVAGMELAGRLQRQAERFGARIELGEVVSIAKHNGLFQVTLISGKVVLAKSVLIATGSEWKKLGILGEAQFYGRGVHNCATCDGAFYKDKKLVVIGGGNSAAQESLFLTKFASQIEILIRKDAWKATDILVRHVANNPKIKVNFQTVTLEIRGAEEKVQSILVDQAGTQREIATDGIFVFVGMRPVTAFLGSSGVALDERGFVLTNRHLHTNVDGLFCAGDVRSGATMQIASAIGEGATAALSISRFLDDYGV